MKLSFLVLVVVAATSLAKPAFAADASVKLNKVLVSISKKNPGIFGSDPLCKQYPEFWSAVKRTSLLEVLKKEEGFEEYRPGGGYVLWAFPVSVCFAGATNPGIDIVVKDGDKYKDLGVMQGSIENLKLKGDTLTFSATSFGGCDEYRGYYAYRGKKLISTKVRHISHCN